MRGAGGLQLGPTQSQNEVSLLGDPPLLGQLAFSAQPSCSEFAHWFVALWDLFLFLGVVPLIRPEALL